MTLAEAAAAGVQTLLIGAAPVGGVLPERWIGDLVTAIRAGMDIASGLHAKLNDIPELVAEAKAAGRALHDVRHPTTRFTRSEEHTSELQSLMRISYGDFCLEKKTCQTQT